MRRGVAKKLLVALSVLSGGLCLTVFHERIDLFYMTSFAQNSFQQSSAQACCYVELRGGFIKQFPVASNKLKTVYITICHSCVVMSGSACKSDEMTLNASILYNKRTGLVAE